MKIATKGIVLAICAATSLPASLAFVESSDLRRHALNQLDLPLAAAGAVTSIQPPKAAAVSIHAGEDTTVIHNHEEEEPINLSLGKPIAFETPLFKGKILIRLKNAQSSDADPESHNRYFFGEGDKHRQTRLMQSVVQGQFKKAIKMSELYVGSVLSKPLAKQPPGFVCRALEKAFRKVQPGAIVDIGSARPKVMAIYAGSAQAVCMNGPQEEEDELPDMLAPDIEEYLPQLPFGGCPSKRMRHLSHPKHAANYEYDTDHIYTFHTYNEVLDFGLGTVKVPLIGAHDIKPMVGSQPFQLSAMVSSTGETLYHFEIRH